MPPLVPAIRGIELSLALDGFVLSLRGLFLSPALDVPVGWSWRVVARDGDDVGRHFDARYGKHRLTTKASASPTDHNIAGA